jgi:flavin-dependent dehydrogenase
VVDRFELGFRFRRRFERRSRVPLILMTQRRRLDAYLAERAAEAGAVFRDGVKVTAIETGDDGVVVTAGEDRVAASVVVGADGANGVSARALGLGPDYTYGVALEGNLSYADADPGRFRGRAVIELGSIPGGYAWVFPKGEHVNVGVGGWESQGPGLRDHLRHACRAYGLDDGKLTDVRGFRLPLRKPGAVPVHGRGLLVGDAAGLVDPLSGDGMYEAFVSARLAGEAVLDVLAGRAPDLSPYAAALSQAITPLASASWGAKLAFDRFPRLSYGIARTPFVWPVVERLLRGDVSHPSAVGGLARAPVRALEALAHAAGDPGRGYRLETARN